MTGLMIQQQMALLMISKPPYQFFTFRKQNFINELIHYEHF